MKLLNVDANVHDDKGMHGLGVMGGLSVALPWSGGSRAMSPTSLSSCQVISINHSPWSWTSILIMILCVYLMFCRRLECYNTGGCLLVESRPINKVCFRRMWREWLGLSFKPISQEDVEADYEKLERRSRIRTARARQINPQVIRKMDENNWRRSTFLAKKM